MVGTLPWTAAGVKRVGSQKMGGRKMGAEKWDGELREAQRESRQRNGGQGMRFPVPIPLPPFLCQHLFPVLLRPLGGLAGGPPALRRGFLFDRGWGRSRNVAACRRRS